MELSTASSLRRKSFSAEGFEGLFEAFRSPLKGLKPPLHLRPQSSSSVRFEVGCVAMIPHIGSGWLYGLGARRRFQVCCKALNPGRFSPGQVCGPPQCHPRVGSWQCCELTQAGSGSPQSARLLVECTFMLESISRMACPPYTLRSRRKGNRQGRVPLSGAPRLDSVFWSSLSSQRGQCPGDTGRCTSQRRCADLSGPEVSFPVGRTRAPFMSFTFVLMRRCIIAVCSLLVRSAVSLS